MAATRCFRGDRAALTALRLCRIISFLRRHGLYDTAHDLERHTGAFFDAAHFRRLLRHLRWADASSYALGFVTAGHCSREADVLIVRILTLRVMPVLLSMRSDRARASRLYHRSKTLAVDVILNMAAKCPELKAKSQLPRCTFDPAYALSLGPGLWGCKMRQKNKVGCIPAHVIACSFVRKRPHLVNRDTNYSGKKHSTAHDAHFPESSEQPFDSRNGDNWRVS
ncbi:unnamed protein product [Urochloa decumbens]|uniref:Uncharacterized protein n=1 Tax=Urochloa decumbens TaxID=240449 RepID=A0ABC8ZR79_9POAL